MRLDPAPARSARLPLVDAARGVAIVAMAIYHFSWDLQYFGYIAANVGADLGWRIFARLIAGSFLFLVGAGLTLAAERGMDWRRYGRRLALIAVAAAGITVVTWFVFPDSYIFFGILHCIALSSVLALPFLRLPWPVVLVVAAACIAAPHIIAGPAFDRPGLLWLGLMTSFPRSNDFVPIFPWFGMVLAGLAAGRLLRKWPVPLGSAAVRRWPLRHLAWAGRHSLPIYLIHQPLLFGLVAAAASLAPPGRETAEAGFVESCVAYCVAENTGEAICRQACACLAGEAQAGGLWEGVLAGHLEPLDLDRYRGMARQCRAAALEQ